MRNQSLRTADRLVTDRTRLANERTLLAYVRTALVLLAFGAGLIHFFLSVMAQLAGVLLLLVGGATLVAGARRYFEVRRRLSVGPVPALHERRNGRAVGPPRLRPIAAVLPLRGRT